MCAVAGEQLHKEAKGGGENWGTGMKVEEAETHRRWEEFTEEGRRGGANDEWKRREDKEHKILLDLLDCARTALLGGTEKWELDGAGQMHES